MLYIFSDYPEKFIIAKLREDFQSTFFFYFLNLDRRILSLSFQYSGIFHF